MKKRWSTKPSPLYLLFYINIQEYVKNVVACGRMCFSLIKPNLNVFSLKSKWSIQYKKLSYAFSKDYSKFNFVFIQVDEVMTCSKYQLVLTPDLQMSTRQLKMKKDLIFQNHSGAQSSLSEEQCKFFNCQTRVQSWKDLWGHLMR